MDLQALLPLAIRAAEEASEKILEVYHSDNFDVELKGDQSPLTRADRLAHKTIIQHLETTGIPIISEEGNNIPYADRKAWKYFWLVDPLDGTKEFLKRNGEFTVNIALVHQQQPVLGVVAVPVNGDVFYGGKSLGAYLLRGKTDKRLSIRPAVNLKQSGLRVVASRSHINQQTQQFIDRLESPTLISKGSSLKFMLLAEGLADIYPRFAPTMEWDTAAAHAIVQGVGVDVYQANRDMPLLYNKESLLNPDFLCY